MYALVHAASQATPHGQLNSAAVPVPSTEPAVVPPAAPPPASVVTLRVARAMMRMRLAERSATMRTVPAASTATPYGWLKVAAEPMPSATPAAAAMGAPPPATTETAPDGSATARMTLLLVSET